MKSSGTKTGLLIILLIAVALAGIVIVFRNPSPKRLASLQPKHPIEIGAILPLSGSLAFMGRMEGDGMRLAI